MAVYIDKARIMTYKFPITQLASNEIFVFGSNTEGRHGAGAALWAKLNAGAIYGRASGLQGKSYGIVTKNLKKKIHPSILQCDIISSIGKFYKYAYTRPGKKFLVAYTNKPNLNGYSPKDMAMMFAVCSPIPSNIVFGDSFFKLVKASIKVRPPLSIIMDTREQKPLWTKKQCQRYKLDYGDYTTEKLHGKYHIERKSLQDLYGTIIQGHVRFRNELIGAKTNGVKLSLYVEGSRNNFIAKKFPGGHRRLINGNVLAKIVNTVENRYGIDVVWCGSRATSKKMMVERFRMEERKLKSISKV